MALQGGDDNVEAVVNGGSRKRENGNRSSWPDLPSVLLEIIMSQLGLIDFFMVACVCKSWRAVALRFRPQFMSSQGPLVFLMAKSPRKNGYFYNMFDESLYRATLPHLRSRTCMGFTCGYLVLVDSNMSRPRDSIWFVNPFTRHELQFPRPPRRCARLVMASLVYSSPAQGQQYVVVAYSETFPYLQFCRYGDEEWTVYDCNTTDWTIADVAVFKGKIYVFTSDGILATLHLNTRINNLTVTMQQLSLTIKDRKYKGANVNLVAYDQHLHLTVYRGFEVKVYRVDFEKMAWEKVRGMNGEILFLSDKKSCAFTFPTPTPEPPLDPLQAIVGAPLNRACYLGEEGRGRFGDHVAHYLAGKVISRYIPARPRDGKPNINLISPLWYFPHLSCVVDPVYEEEEGD